MLSQGDPASLQVLNASIPTGEIGPNEARESPSAPMFLNPSDAI